MELAVTYRPDFLTGGKSVLHSGVDPPILSFSSPSTMRNLAKLNPLEPERYSLKNFLVFKSFCMGHALPLLLPFVPTSHASLINSSSEALNCRHSQDQPIEMIRFRLKELIAEKEFQEGRRITLDEIAKATYIHRTTLSKVSNQKGYNTTTEVLDKLCDYFQVSLGQLAEHIKDENQGSA